VNLIFGVSQVILHFTKPALHASASTFLVEHTQKDGEEHVKPRRHYSRIPGHERLRRIRELTARTQAELDAARAEREQVLDEMLRQMEAQRERLSRLHEGRYEPREFPRVSDKRAVYEEMLNRFGRPEAQSYHRKNNLAQLYASYGSGSSGEITWDDVERFQRDLMSNTQYIHQPRALHPSEFYASGGGNCVDYSLATADFLGYFGISVVIGGFFAEGDIAGHAVALVPVERVPEGYTPVVLNRDVHMNGRVFPAGTYIPIDYQYVGGFSNATSPTARLTMLWHPLDMFGSYF